MIVGFDIIECADLDEAIEVARAHPMAYGGRIELRAARRPARVTAPAEVLAAAARESYGRIVATLIRVTGDWDLAEDCAQEALAAALERWPADGVPGNPGGWLMTVARNRAIDVLRRAAVERRKLQEIAVLADPSPARRKNRGRTSWTTGCGSSSPAATRRWRWRPGWR